MIRSQKTAVAKFVGVSLIMLLAACSGNHRYDFQVSGDEAYLHTPALCDLKAPEGVILPKQSDVYDIQQSAVQGPIGKQLDIRLPTQQPNH